MPISLLNQALRQGRITSLGLVQHALRQISAKNGMLRAILDVNPGAVAEADAADVRRASGDLRGPLDGIPILIKGNIDTADDLPTTAGSLAMVGNRPARDAFVVRRLRESGAVLLGTTNLSEWANFRASHSCSGWSALAGQTANPYVLDRNPSGSSSGSAVAVAAGLAPVSVGTETDGSILSPAGACGIVGVKPTLGLVSRSGIIPISAQQDTAGPMARSVHDAALLLAALAGADPDDPATVAYGGPLTDLDVRALHGARIGVWHAGSEDVHGGTAEVFAAAVQQLRRLGAETIELAELPHLEEIPTVALPALRHEFRHDLEAYLAASPGRHPRSLAELIAYNLEHAAEEMPLFAQDIFLAAEQTSGNLDDADYRRLRSEATALARASIDQPLHDHDLTAIVAPTNSPAPVTARWDEDHEGVSSSTPAATAGYPSLTVPMGFVGPLPVGLTFIGPAWSERRLLSLAYAFEHDTRARRAPRYLPTC